jgi:hypothetical protein
MDGAEASDLNSAFRAYATHERVGGRGACDAVWNVSSDETSSSADLGGSSNYSNENFED